MQEIKFRAWNKGNNEWLKGRDLCIYLDGSISIFGNPPCPTNIFPKYNPLITIVQFTGLYDKNGKEIYEGDIIQWNGYEVQNGKQIRPIRKRAIGMTVDAFRNSFIDDCFHLQNLLEQGSNIEVIGNVHENPELIQA